MALRPRRLGKGLEEKMLDVDASMQGTLTFRDPVNLRINGKFEGNLDTKGTLTIGENAVVIADIKGEVIVIAGKVTGNVVAEKKLRLSATAQVIGDIKAPVLNIMEGGILEGRCQMTHDKKSGKKSQELDILNVEELARYLELDSNSILEWAGAGRIPAIRDGDSWRFERTKIDEWIASEKIK